MPRNGSGRAGMTVASKERQTSRKRPSARPAPETPSERSEAVTPLGLALPGGGAYGAFTWGVLDRLLEEGDLRFPRVSGASAGAVNAVALAQGFAEGGAEGARGKLAEVWERTAALAAFSPLQPSPLDRLLRPGGLDFSPGYRWMDTLSRLFSPYQFNAFDLNPLREVLRQTIDFAMVRDSTEVQVHIAATNVRRGRIRIFGPRQITLDTVIASTCLPFLNKAVEIEGEPYWDGAYLANPPLRPLLDGEAAPEDLLLVELDGLEQPGTPTSPQEIFDRLNSLSGAGGLLAELEWLAASHPEVRLHGIAEPQILGELSASSRLNADWRFLVYLRDLGRTAAETWLAGSGARIGQVGTYEIPSRYL